MSKVFLKVRSGINLGALTADPSDPRNGDFYYNSTNNVFRGYLNGAWHNIVGDDLTQLLTNKTIGYSSLTDSTTTGSDASIASPTTGIVRLTNSSLISLGGIPGGTSGLQLIIENKTGNQISIVNEDAGVTAANRIQTGTGGNASMMNNASFEFVYDAVSDRWQLVGGTGVGASGSKNYLSTVVTSNNSGNPNVGNGNFELGTTAGWSEFTTTMTGVIPSGTITPGDASHTISIVTSGVQLSGNYSLDWASTSTTGTAGRGFISDPFFIDTSDQVKILNFSFNYSLISGSNLSILDFSGTSSNTFAVYIYDVTNTNWIQPIGVYNMTQKTGTQLVTGAFQTTSNSTQYRLAVMIVNSFSPTSTVMYFDDFSIGPQSDVANFNPDPLTANVGSVIASASAIAPPGFLPCDGSPVSRTVYSALFNMIGITHGEGNNTTTFNLPDYRSRFLRGTDNMGGPSGAANRDPGARSAMNTGGNATGVGSIEADALQNVTGTVTNVVGAGLSFAGSGAFATTITANNNNAAGGQPSGVLSLDLSRVARTSTETRPINASVNFYIRYLPLVGGQGIGISGTVAMNATATAVSVGAVAANQSFATTITDTNSGFNGTTYQIPVSGIFNSSCFGFLTTSSATGSAVVTITKNGVQVGTPFDIALTATTQTFPVSAAMDGIQYNAGDIIAISMSQNTGATVTFTGAFSVVLDGGGVQATQARIFQAPQISVLTTGTIYPVPLGTLYLKIKVVGAGGGGGSTGTDATGGAGGTGGTTSFGGLTAFGGGGGPPGFGGGPQAPALGGFGSGGNILNTRGNPGDGRGNGNAAQDQAGCPGASGPWGGAGTGGTAPSGVGGSAANGFGSGGGGAGGSASTATGWSGAAGGYVEHIQTSPATNYTYSIGGHGIGGTAGTSGAAGGNGSGGVVIVEAYFQ